MSCLILLDQANKIIKWGANCAQSLNGVDFVYNHKSPHVSIKISHMANRQSHVVQCRPCSRGELVVTISRQSIGPHWIGPHEPCGMGRPRKLTILVYV